jgi:hypothetical protein
MSIWMRVAMPTVLELIRLLFSMTNNFAGVNSAAMSQGWPPPGACAGGVGAQSKARDSRDVMTLEVQASMVLSGTSVAMSSPFYCSGTTRLHTRCRGSSDLSSPGSSSPREA